MRTPMMGLSYDILSLECDRSRFPSLRSWMFELRKVILNDLSWILMPNFVKQDVG